MGVIVGYYVNTRGKTLHGLMLPTNHLSLVPCHHEQRELKSSSELSVYIVSKKEEEEVKMGECVKGSLTCG